MGWVSSCVCSAHTTHNTHYDSCYARAHTHTRVEGSLASTFTFMQHGCARVLVVRQRRPRQPRPAVVKLYDCAHGGGCVPSRPLPSPVCRV